MAKRIIVTIPRAGLSVGRSTIKVDVDGVIGTGCVALTDKLVERLGGTVVDTEIKPEYHQVEVAAEQHIDQHGTT